MVLTVPLREECSRKCFVTLAMLFLIMLSLSLRTDFTMGSAFGLMTTILNT